MFVGSPIRIVAGVVTVAGTQNTDTITGTVVCIRDSKGEARNNKPANTAGWTCEYTYEPDEEYLITHNGTQGAATDIGMMYNLTAETAVAATATSDGDVYSKRQLNSSTENATGRQLQVVGVAGHVFGNDPSTAGYQVVVRINPANYSAGAAS
ncbi:MAG: hypothetical protein N2111_13885 [Candidatus Sumerlaeaceae bacterium]|nr:hypothetical protein [Candidatus Sumerlaeaceae bacterium]